jgi:hypothetical protein
VNFLKKEKIEIKSLKICSKCKKPKDINEFNKHKKTKGGLYSQCKLCVKEYRDKHKEQQKEYNKKYHFENREKMLQRMKIHYEQNREEESLKAKKYLEKNKEIINEKKKIYINLFTKFDSKCVQQLINFKQEVRENDSWLEVRCKKCENWFIPLNKQVEARLNAIKGNSTLRSEFNFYCSDECKNKCPLYKLKSDPNEIISKELRIQIPKWLRKEILDRDNNECIICGYKDNLELHHEKPIKENSFFQLDKDYIHTICRTCHLFIHRQDGLCSLNELRNKSCKKY